MKIMTIILFCTLSFVVCKSQTTIDFNVSLRPNSVYTISTKTNSRTEIVPQKNENVVDQKGVGKESVVESTSKNSLSLTTGSIKPNQSFSWVMTFDSINSTKAINSNNPIKGLAIEGTYDKNKKMHIDSLTCNSFDENTREVVKASTEKIFEQSAFPFGQVSIGDELIHKTPVELPSKYSGTIMLYMNTRFRLTAIKDDIAFFELSQNLDSIKTKGNSINGFGQGTGNCEYNFKKNYITKYQTSSNTNMTLKLFGEITKCKINSTYSQKTILRD